MRESAPERVEAMLRDVDAAIRMLESERLHRLIMVSQSDSYVDRLVAEVHARHARMEKLRRNIADLLSKREELRLANVQVRSTRSAPATA